MSDTSYFDLYKALKADGAVQGDWGSFHKFVGAPGKQGYLNRKKLYDALKADGAVQSNTYEEFNMKLFRGGQANLKAAKQRQAVNSQTQQQKTIKPQTTAQMAMSQGYKQPTTATPTGTDYMQNWQLMHKRNDQMNPTERMQANTMRSRMQQAQKQATQQEQRRANPISQSRVTPNAQNFNETMQQLATPQAQRARAVQQRVDDATNLAEYEITGNNFVHNDGKQGTISPEIDSLVAPSMKEADDLSWTQYQQDLKNAGNDAYLRNKAWKDLQDNRIKNRQNVLADNLSAKLQEIYSQKGLQEHIIESADKLNMGVEEYVDKYVTPQMMQRAQNILGVKNIEEVLPQSATEYVTRRLSDSILGTLSAGQDKSREQIAREQEAMAIADGLEEMPTVNGYKANEGYKSGVGARFVSTAANMAMDSPILGMTGSGANLTVDLGKQVLMKGLAKAGLVKAGAKLTTQQLAFKAANMTMAQKIASGLVEGTAKSALNLGGYSSITAALGQASTGDDTSLSALGQAALGGFEHGATTGAMFGVSGAIMAPWVSKFGINGLETSTGEKWLHGAQKFGATAAGLGVEAGTMMVADNITGDKDISVGTWLEDLVMVGAFKAGEPKNYGNIGRALYGLTHNTNSTFRVGKDANGKWRTVDIRMTKEEQNELMNSVSGKNLVEAFQKVDKSSLNSKTPLDKSITKLAYENFMKDPNVSQSTKEKVNAAMGLFNTTRGRSYRSVNDVKNKQILEYSKNGTLLTRTSYKNADERRAILYKQKLYRDNEEMRSLAGYSKLKDLQLTDENGEVTKLALGFLVNKGYNVNENAAEANNARLVASLRDKNSDLYKEWEQYVNRHGMLGELISENVTFDSSIMAGIKDMLGLKDARINLDTIMRKDPMKRTDEENKIFYAVKNQLEAELFPNGKPHAEQSETQGRNVAEENNLGSEQPNPQPVMDELRNLRAAEQALEQAMDGNDVFKQVFEQCQKQGIRPVEAYDVLIQNGLTQEEIAPLADYINANARVQGMQTATQQAIEEHVGARVSDWSYKGSLNGGNEIPMGMDASKMLYVNWNGKTYIVGNGDVSFDSTGRAKEDVGDMLVCLDPETNTMEYIPTREVTFGGTESANDYAAKYREQLQMINSQPYNAAAQEQAMQDAAKPQSKEEAQQTPENGGENAGVESRPQNAPQKETSSESQEVKPDQAPGQNEQSQQVRKFADGTDVPMTTDSKGRPTPDYGSMKPEQAAEILTQDFGENAEKVVDGQVKKAEKALKDAENMKVDYSAEPNDILEQEQVKAQTIEAAKQQLEQAQNIRKAMTAKKVAETVAKPSESEKVDEANQASPIVREKFDGSKKVAGRRGSITLPGGKKIRGTYYYGETSGLTPSHDPFSDFKQNEGFPVNEDGTTANSRSYKDKGARQFTEQIGNNFNGLALKNVPVVQDGVVLSGNGTTMAKLLAERNGKDGQYREDLNDNIEGFGLTPEKIAEVGDKGIVYFVPDEKFPLSSKTFDMFNKRETKSESNTEQAVAKAKTLTADEVGAIVADIEGNGSLDAFFNNSKAINDLVRTLVDKGIIGQNEVDGFMDGTERLSAQGKEYVKNLLLGSVFKPETIRMLGIDGKIKNAAINGIRAIMDNLKLGDYSLRDELDQAVQLLYEARRSKMSVEDLLRQNSAFDGNARDRFPMIAQAMAQALEGKTSTFRELMNEYNDIAKNYNTSEGTLDFYDKLTPEHLVDEFLNASKAIKNNNIKLYGKDSETESGNDAASNEEPAKEAGGAVGTEGNEPAATEPEIKVKKALKRIATEITKQTGIEVVTDDKVGQSALEDAEATDSNVKFHKETDEEVLNALNSGETIKVYRAMQVIDGKLYPPMAASVGGKLVEANELGVWIRADENPDLAIPDIDPKTGKQKVDKKTGEPKWKFKLDKGGKDATGKKATDVNAAYNPYWHMSRSPLNDQFKSAWIRPNIVVVECEVPVSELTSGYKAERAKDAVGEVDWKSGSVSGEVFKQTGRARKVILSRWCKPVRVLDDAEVAQRAKEFIGEAKVEIPENVLTPKQRIAFEEAGFKIGAPEKGVKKSEQILEALEKGLQIDNSVREQRDSRWAGGEVLGMDKLPKENQMNPNELASEISQYHSDYITRMLENVPEDGTGTFFSAHNGTWYLYTVSKEDRSINLLKAFTASRENFDKFKEAIKDYGFNSETEDIYSNLQEAGRADRSDSDLLDAFLRGGAGRDNRVHSGKTEGEANDGNLGMDGRTGEDTPSPRYFRSANGEVYGFTVDGKIYLDTKKMKPETPLHEYTHLWTEALRNSNPTEWENVKGIFDEVEGLEEEVLKLYPELKGDDLYEEMITTFSGREGAKKLEEVVRGLAAEDGKTVEESAKASGFIGKVKEALKKYWKGVADMLHIHFTSAEEVADKVLADWASGFNPRDFDDLHDKELEGRIKVTDEETETPSEYGPIMKQKILIDGDKEVTKVDEPNEKGDYTGSYYEYDGKKFGDLREVADYIDGNAKSNNPLPVMPKPVEPSNPIEKAAEDYKKEHPLTEEELLNTTAFDDLPEDQKQYCIDAALDYLNGEDNSAIAEAYYRNAYEKRSVPSEGNKLPKPEQKNAQAEQKSLSSDPMEGLKNAAEGYEETKKAKSATERVKEIIQTPRGQKPKTTSRKELEAERDAADNEFEAFMKELRKKRSGQLNSGFIDQNLVEAAPKMFSLAAKCAYTRIKLGMYDAKEVVKDLRERFKEAFDGFDKRDIETFYSEIMNQKWRDGDKRMSLNDWAEHYRKLSPEYKEKLEGDSKDAEERKANEDKFISNIGAKLLTRQKIEGIKQLRQIAKECGLEDVKDTDLQELAESAVVRIARGISGSNAISEAQKFDTIKKLYEDQPSLNQRDSERVMKQQYSTPAPYAFLADMYVKGNGKEVKSALEPSAGNGMLTIGLPMDAVHVNDIDAQRLANLRRQGFKNVTSQDGTQPFADKDVDVVVTNPPFGSATPKEYNGYKIGSLEGQMAINALESMKDDGRAAIIIGGKTEYAKNGSLNPKDKAFLGYLYSHYNVEDVINVDGSLYAKQGTTYPTRIILINGRRLDENVFPPVKSKARAEAVKDYDELYKRISDDILRGERMDSSIKEGEGNARPELDRPSSADTHEEGVRAGGERGGEPSDKRGAEQSEEPSVSGADDVLENRPTADREPDGGLSGGDNSTDRTGTEPSQSEGTEARTNDERVSEQGGTGRVDSEPSNDRPSASNRSGERPRGQLQRMDKSVRGLSTEKVTYAPKSGNPFTLKAVMPSDQQEAVNKNLEKLGDADQFLVDELGYNDKDDLYSHLAAEQVDSVALALQQAKKGNAFIIGDMTGIGKGRQAASLIRYAKKQGQVPVYFTKTAGLLSDVYRDLVDIGSPELRPFVFGSAKEAAITDADGKVVFPLPTKNEVKRVLDYIEKNGELPKEYDYVLTTYSQVSNGIYEFDENGNRKERKIGKNKSFGAAAFSGQRRRDAIEKLMANGYLILDESHTAGGNSGQGNYFQHIIQKAKNVTFFSATFAKRPDNMPIYALRTAMNQGGLKAPELIDAVKRGGATLQEIMSQTLTQCGQMIRRERDMTGVTIDWRAIDEPEKVKEQREQYDSIIGLFNDIINFQKTYVSHYVEDQNEAMAAMQASMGIKRGTEALGIKNVPFASKAFNTVQQVLLSLKAKSAAERAIDYLKQGMKPVIALNNTNESQTGNIALGEEMDAPDLGTSLRKGLEGTLRYTSKNAKDESSSGYIKLEDLGDDAVEAYHNLEKKIEETSTGLSLSPIDVIKNELEKAGYKVGELTGRSTEFVYNDNGTVTKVKRADTDKKKLAREFNDGQIDALILNKSAATGISLHASSKYKDQKKRVMIVAQQQLDVNDEVQMRGRIDRTGQVARGAYEYVVSLIPAEQRLLMMFKAKLKSLDANTTSSQKSKFNEMEVADITNKYGDKVVKEYMAEHLDLYSRMADPFGWEKSLGEDLSSIDPQSLVASGGGVGDGEAGADASKLLGRMALLRVEEQEKMLQEIGELYANEIQRLNEMGENDLEITELPLKAKTIRKEVWKQGAEPGGDNAFADNTYIEKVNMAILKKPMKAAEVKASQEGLTGGKTWEEYKAEKKAAVKEYFDQKIADETQRYEERAVKVATKAKEKYIKDGKKGQKDSGMTDEQIEKNAGYQYDTFYKQEKDKLNDVVKNLKAKAEMFDRVLDTFDTNGAFVLPMDMNNPNELSGFGNSYGRLIDIKITDNFSPNASSVSFATLDGRRKITFPIAGKVGAGDNNADVISAIDNMTKQAIGMGDSHLRVLNQNFDNWDRLTSNESRKNGYIVTGNLMQALVDSKDQGLGGQLVKYTTDTGEVKTGILMPDRFAPKGLTTDAPINSVADKFELSSWHGGIDEVTSSDGEVKVKRIDNNRGNFYELRVPKSKAKGGKYFLDNDLLKLVNGNNFETRGNNMLAEFKPEQLKPVLDRLSKMGVKVQEERNTSEDISDAPNVTSVVPTETNNRGLEKKPLLDVEPVDPVVWMREHPGQLPTTTDLFGHPHVDAQLGKELGSKVLGVTDAGVKMSRIDYEGGYIIRADGNNHDYVAQTYYPDGQVMTRTHYDIGMDGGQLKKYVKFDKNGIPYSTIDDAIKNFMENMGKPKQLSSDNDVHFREEDPQEIELSKDEYAVLAHTIDSSHKNYKRGKVNYEYTADNFYVFKYNKYNDYNVYQKIPIDGNEELINYIKDGINKETIRNPRDIDSALEAGWNGRNGHYWDSTSNQEGRGGSVRFGEVSSLRSRNGRPSDERMGEELSDSPSSAVNNHIERIAKNTGAKVSMISSVDEITNKAAKDAIEEGRKITGWYDEKTGEVHLYMPNIHNRYTAEKTIWHEVVGHKGMRELFGDERFDKFLRDVWYDLDKPENAALKKLVDEERKYNPLNIYDAIEEGIARLAEDGKGEAGFWNGIKNKVSDFLHEIGYRVAPNTKDVKYLLWLSKNLQKNPNDPYWKMRAEAVKYRLDHDRMPAVVAHDGMFYGNDGKERSMENLTKAEWDEATDGQIHFRTTPSAGTALDRYHRSLDEHGYMFTESYMDNMLSLKKLMNAIVPDKKIEDIASSENPYILQNTMQGAMSDAAQMFERNVMKPLDKAMADVLDAFDGKKDDEKIRNFNLYMITKHGLERNRIFYVRDALKYMRMNEKTEKLADTVEFDWNNEKARLDEELERGDIDLKEYYSQMDDFIRTYVDSENKFDAGEHDYSGIHAIQEIEKSSDPYDDAAAIASVMDSESKMEDIKKGSVADYWNKVKAATQYSLYTDYKNGLISRELYGHVSDMFNWYVPLRKYDEATAEDTYGYITEKGDPKSYIGSTIMRAIGHKYLSETNVLAQIGAIGNRAINNGGKNAIKQAFARFIRNHSNNNLVTETSVWYADDPITQTTVERYPDIPEDATPDEISQIVADFNTKMKDLESKGLATKVYRRGKIGYKFQRAENKSQHIVDVMIAGKKHSFIVNGNPRAAQALNGLLEHKNETGIGKIAGKIARVMAQTCTSYNPEFVMRNMMRDFEFASSNLLAKEGTRYTATFEKYYAKVGIIEGIRNSKLSDFKDTGGFGLFAKYRNGTLDTSDKIQRYFKEFMENGGETGWVQVKNMKEWTDEYKRNIKAERNKASKIGKGFYNAIFKNLENVNEIAENMARFATYCASRDYGRSVVRSTYDAKEVSTNFNRHGSGSEIKSFKNGEMGGFQNFRKNTYRFTSAWFRNTSMFFNAGIQSTNLLVKNLKNNTAGTLGYIASGPMISGMAMALLNNFLIANEDEKDRKGVKDPYGELPDYIRRNNLCVYVGGGEFVTIPLAIEERAFYGLGDLAAGLTFSPNVSGQKNPFLDAVGCMSQLVPVADYLGNASFGKHPVQETVKAVMPSATSPFIEWAYNSDWKGAPIERDNKFDENQPAWMLAYKGTPDFLISLNKKANAYTNDVAKGNEDMKGNDFLDALTNPSGLQHFYSGYLGGAATFAERSLGLIKHGKDAETKDIPFVRSIFYTPSEQSSLQRTKSKWYNYKDEMETTIANVDRLKSKNVPIDKRIANIGDYYNFQNSKDAAKVRVIELAEKQMKVWKKLRDKSGDTESIKFANENIDRIMMEAVEQLDNLN